MNWLDDLEPPLSGAEDRFLRRMLERLRSLESRTRGVYAESLLCELLPGVRASDYAAAAHDLEWPQPAGGTLTISVKTSGSRNSDHGPDTEPSTGSWEFDPAENWSDPDSEGERRCWADVAVLCFHDGWDLAEGWTFYVLAGSQVDSYPTQSITTGNLATNGYTSVGPEELADAVSAAARGSR